MKKIITVIVLFFIALSAFADDAKQPTPPIPPTAPVVPGAGGNTNNSFFPAFPSPPKFPANNQTNEPVSEIERYDLTVSEAFPNGNKRNNAANTIKNAQYVLYSDRSAELRLSFINSQEYIYYLKNPRSKIETSAGIFRETFDTLVQAGKDLLLNQYTSELYYNNDTITSFNLIENGRVIVLLNVRKKT
jgi:hypothetical protein